MGTRVTKTAVFFPRFNQTLDHFDPENQQTFMQRYQMNGTFYKAGGPLFVLLG